MKLRSRVCPICRSNDSTRVFLAANYDESKLDAFSFASRKLPEFMHFRMVCCPTCDLLYATPAPHLDWVHQQYQSADFDGGEESQYAALTYARHLGRIVNRLPDLENRNLHSKG